MAPTAHAAGAVLPPPPTVIGWPALPPWDTTLLLGVPAELVVAAGEPLLPPAASADDPPMPGPVPAVLFGDSLVDGLDEEPQANIRVPATEISATLNESCSCMFEVPRSGLVENLDRRMAVGGITPNSSRHHTRNRLSSNQVVLPSNSRPGNWQRLVLVAPRGEPHSGTIGRRCPQQTGRSPRPKGAQSPPQMREQPEKGRETQLGVRGRESLSPHVT